MSPLRTFIVKVGALAFPWEAASSFDAINDARDRFGLGVAISARPA